MNRRMAFASVALLIASTIECGCTVIVNQKADSTDGNDRVVVNSGNKYIIPDKNIITRSGECKGLLEIEASTAIKVLYIESEGDNYVIAAPSNVMPYVRCEYDDGKLEMGFRNSPGFKNSPNVTVTVYAPKLEKVELHGASSLESARITNPGGKMEFDLSGASSVSLENIELSTLDLDLSGASSIVVKALKASVLKAELSGASGANLSGTAAYADFDVSGASSLSAKNLKVDKGNAECSGASNAEVNIKTPLNFESSGMSKISNAAK